METLSEGERRMTQENFYYELMNEFKKQLNRELCREELEFIAWVNEKHLEEILYNKISS